MDTRLKRNFYFHYQTDRKTKMVNKIVVQLLRRYLGKHPKTWDEHLMYIQYSYNKEIHNSINKTPFKICFGYLPPSPFDCNIFG